MKVLLITVPAAAAVLATTAAVVWHQKSRRLIPIPVKH